MSQSKIAGALAAALLMVGGAGSGVAHAETKTKADKEGDAPANIDVTEARYTHGKKRVRVTAQIPGLGSAGKAALSISKFEIFEAGYVVQIIKRRGKPAKVGLFYFNHFDLEKRACDEVTGTWGEGAVRLSVARDCLVGHAKPEVFVQFGIVRGDKVDRAPAIRRLQQG